MIWVGIFVLSILCWAVGIVLDLKLSSQIKMSTWYYEILIVVCVVLLAMGKLLFCISIAGSVVFVVIPWMIGHV